MEKNLCVQSYKGNVKTKKKEFKRNVGNDKKNVSYRTDEVFMCGSHGNIVSDNGKNES